jgi:hypothetical protein
MNANIKQNFTRYIATPAVMAGLPGARWHRGMHHLTNLQPTV